MAVTVTKCHFYWQNLDSSASPPSSEQQRGCCIIPEAQFNWVVYANIKLFWQCVFCHPPLGFC